MKIIVVHYKYYIQGGPERYMFNFIDLAKKHGCETIPFSVNCSSNFETPYSKYFVGQKDDGANYDPKNHNLFYLAKNVWHEFHNNEACRKLKKLIRDVKPDLIYVLIPGQLSTDIFKIAKKEKIPVFLRISDFRTICGNNILLCGEEICEKCIHGSYRHCFKNKCVKKSKAISLLRALSLRYARKHNKYKWVDAVITPPKFTAEKLIESGMFDREKVYVLPTFVNCLSRFDYSRHSDYVLCLGRFSKEKGFIYVLRSLEYLRDLPVKVAITGSKENCDKNIIDCIEELGIEEKIIFVGFVSGKELDELISNSLCVAAPAIWYENMPNAVLEAFAHGKPVIATNHGSLREIVVDEHNGLLFNNKDTLSIANCIRRLYEDPKLYKDLSLNARFDAENLYSPEVHFTIFLNIYKTVVKEKN